REDRARLLEWPDVHDDLGALHERQLLIGHADEWRVRCEDHWNRCCAAGSSDWRDRGRADVDEIRFDGAIEDGGVSSNGVGFSAHADDVVTKLLFASEHLFVSERHLTYGSTHRRDEPTSPRVSDSDVVSGGARSRAHVFDREPYGHERRVYAVEGLVVLRGHQRARPVRGLLDADDAIVVEV